MAESKIHSNDQLIQGLLVISCSHLIKPLNLIEKIVRTLNSSSNESKELEAKHMNFGSDQTVKCYDLQIDNKYYLANIYLFDLQNKDLISKQFADCVHGVVIYFDNNEASSFVWLESWLPFINEYNSQIKILVCETASDNCAVKRKTIQKWCIDNEFELIELCPQIDEEEDDEYVDDFKESNGIIRITQALQAYNWPFMTVKNCPQYTPSSKFKKLIDKEIFNSISCIGIPEPQHNELESKLDENSEEKLNSLIESNKINDSIVGEDNEFENFEDLFTKFSDMKVKASQLNDSERKIYAEKVTLAFWKAVGGVDEDIEGLDQNEDI